jgi:hypothetical protein
MVRSAPPPPFGPPGVAAVVRAASLACQNAVKAQKFVPLQESSEESRLNAIGLNPVLAAMPPEWWPIIESIVAHRRPPLVTAASKATSDDHEIPTFLRRELIAAPLKAEVASPLKHDPNIDDPGAGYSTAAGRGMAEGPPFLGELRR